jgi:hypothetical protein
MSWDIFIQDLPEVKSLADIPDDFCPKPIGKRADLIRRIQEVAPMADFSNPPLGTLDADNFSIEFSLGEEKEVYCIACFIRGASGGGACIAAILQHLGLKAVDTATGEFFDLNDPELGFEIWRAYKDKSIKKCSENSA